MASPPIYFYLPQPYFPKRLPASAAENWPGFGLGLHAWTLQTYLRLKEEGFPCQLVDRLPSEGIVLLHHNALRVHQKPVKPSPKLLLICIKAEGDWYPYAQLHVVQNPAAANPRNGWHYLPHWTQPGLIPRCQRRGDRLETIAYFGHTANLAPELQSPSWERQLAALGLRWQPIINHNRWDDFQQVDSRWHDYSQIDAIVAVRRFHTREKWDDKPATKLYNAWLAGVPALLGVESAYRSEGTDQVNYLEVTSLKHLLTTLQQLQTDLPLHHALVKNGAWQAQSFLPAKITQKWREFLLEIAVPAFSDWVSLSNCRQRMILEKNFLLFLGQKVKSKVLPR
ncbi:MAG: hypothetical protein GPJ22_18095 [Microcystis aeruginosa LL13-03]|jgi:hypothetical protein|nr:hypothetical protein [Microcystis aeruginosa SX13-11]NCR19037.1 hypothetical protein [Microcystis aeruginosa LL13-03]NCR45298.1 hypothetical protein [Microcystis aeruginosa SX13-01]NCR68223.1 hypothetical protein [Microcystis aeruginosa LL11-07]NCR90985.1 hypothetical protein [Microcystis aeruginosa G13-10]NCS17523.1 hypothetical protein [Microcystis aeruginosa G13-12]NCS21389.1 hypothetical protein [Microcystis aeruginosa G11-06]NCS36208.1 hypothetical protein [Microcystis aeruginosa G11